jgi:hypothetical protein
MIRSVSQTARILGVDGQQVKAWAWSFKEHLSGQANPAKGRPRAFTDSDVLALMYVYIHTDGGDDIEEIRADLDREYQYNDQNRDLLYANTPILQDPPDDLDETWRHGILLNGGGVDGYLALARNYRESADALLQSALNSGEPRDWGYPVLFAYRHTLELYLKIMGEISKRTHSLKECVRLVEKRHGERLPSPARDWIIELDKIDPDGTAFRYADDQAQTLKYAEFWLDFVQFQFAMARVFRMLDHAVLHAAETGRIERSRI